MANVTLFLLPNPYFSAKVKAVIALLIIVGLLLALMLWLLLAPLIIRVDTARHDYSLSWRGIGRVSVVLLNDELALRVRIFFWRMHFFPLRKPDKPDKPTSAKKRTGIQRRFTWLKAKRLLQSFRIQRFKVELDTDDYALNAQLYPLLYWVSGPSRDLSVNFSGRNRLLLQIENRLFRIVRVLLF